MADGDDATMVEVVRRWVYGVGVFRRGGRRVCDGGYGRREESCCVAVEHLIFKMSKLSLLNDFNRFK